MSPPGEPLRSLAAPDAVPNGSGVRAFAISDYCPGKIASASFLATVPFGPINRIDAWGERSGRAQARIKAACLAKITTSLSRGRDGVFCFRTDPGQD